MTTTHGHAPRKSAPPAKARTAASIGAAEQLGSLIARLQSERQGHEQAIAEIDATFARFGIVPTTPKRRGRPPKAQAAAAVAAKPRRRRARRKFKTSGLDSILSFVKNAGNKGAATAEIVKHWKSEGRSAGAYNMLGVLVKTKKLKKKELGGGKRGSRYTAA